MLCEGCIYYPQYATLVDEAKRNGKIPINGPTNKPLKWSKRILIMDKELEGRWVNKS